MFWFSIAESDNFVEKIPWVPWRTLFHYTPARSRSTWISQHLLRFHNKPAIGRYGNISRQMLFTVFSSIFFDRKTYYDPSCIFQSNLRCSCFFASNTSWICLIRVKQTHSHQEQFVFSSSASYSLIDQFHKSTFDCNNSSYFLFVIIQFLSICFCACFFWVRCVKEHRKFNMYAKEWFKNVYLWFQ